MLKNKGATLSILLAVIMVQMDATIVNVSLPSIAEYFSVDSGLVSWCILIYLLAVSSTLLFLGKLCDIFGVKKVLLAGYILFTAFSFLCGISTSIYMLIFSRFIQGIGGAALYIGVFVFVPKFYPPDQTGKAFGIITTASALGITMGTPVGGFITGMLSWHWIFLINIPIGLMAILILIRSVKEKGIERNSGKNKLDIIGLIMYGVSVFCLFYVLSKGQEDGWMSARIIFIFVIFVIAFISLLVYEKRIKNPLIEFSLFKNRILMLAILSGASAYVFLAASNFLMPFYLELILGLKTDQSGLVLLAYSLPLMIVGPIAGKWSVKFGSIVFCSLTMMLTTLTCVFFAFSLNSGNVFFAILTLFVFGISFGAYNSPNHNFVKSQGAEKGQGVLFGTEQTIYRFSMALGVTIFELIYSMGFSGSASVGSGVITTNEKMLLLTGFKNSFLTGAVFCFLSVVFILLAGLVLRNKLIVKSRF